MTLKLVFGIYFDRSQRDQNMFDPVSMGIVNILISFLKTVCVKRHHFLQKQQKIHTNKRGGPKW